VGKWEAGLTKIKSYEEGVERK
jgi:hypothetical protein